MRIFALGEFDPASVVLGHRDLLRELPGVEFKVALHSAYTPRQKAADWYFEVAVSQNPLGGGRHHVAGLGNPTINFDRHKRFGVGAREELLAYAKAADVWVLMPGIGQPWADNAAAYGPSIGHDPPTARYFDVDWKDILASRSRPPQFIWFFHGSLSTWANTDRYIREFGSGEYAGRFAASTLDYAHALKASYLPPVVLVPGPLAPLREPDEPLIVAHCPTNPAIASTADFFGLTRARSIVTRFIYAKTHAESLEAKRTSHATFDHLRGAFSVNSLEAAALRSVPLFRLDTRYLLADPELADDPPSTYVGDLRGLELALDAFLEDVEYVREEQLRAFEWHARHFERAPILGRLCDFYELPRPNLIWRGERGRPPNVVAALALPPREPTSQPVPQPTAILPEPKPGDAS